MARTAVLRTTGLAVRGQNVRNAIEHDNPAHALAELEALLEHAVRLRDVITAGRLGEDGDFAELARQCAQLQPGEHECPNCHAALTVNATVQAVLTTAHIRLAEPARPGPGPHRPRRRHHRSPVLRMSPSAALEYVHRVLTDSDAVLSVDTVATGPDYELGVVLADSTEVIVSVELA